MIIYPNSNYLPELKAEMLDRTKSYEPYQQGRLAVNYTDAPQSYALNITLLHDSQGFEASDPYVPSPEAEIALVERGSGHGVIGSFSGVTGYIDTMHLPRLATAEPIDEDDEPRMIEYFDPKDDAQFDPIRHTRDEELMTECGFSESDIAAIRFLAGSSFEENRTITPGAKIRIVPLLGLCANKPDIRVDGHELLSVRWVKLSEVAREQNLSKGYLALSLSHSLGALGLGANQIQKLIKT